MSIFTGKGSGHGGRKGHFRSIAVSLGKSGSGAIVLKNSTDVRFDIASGIKASQI
jgi:hypothetical protein